MPPVLAVADASAFFSQLDGILLLARSKACSLDAIIEAREQIRRLSGNLLGVLFNGFDARRASRRGYGYYGYYGGYGRYGRSGGYGSYRAYGGYGDDSDPDGKSRPRSAETVRTGSDHSEN